MSADRGKKYKNIAKIFRLLCDIRKLTAIPEPILNRINSIVDANYKPETLQSMDEGIIESSKYRIVFVSCVEGFDTRGFSAPVNSLDEAHRVLDVIAN